uniref:F-box associated domain-containing protein n=1 Tax=Leersia perrieri TaxID=77586 RepID=A0A0D9X6F2_9ORYZ
MELARRDDIYYTPYVQPMRGALVGDGIHFILRDDNAIIKYNWGMNCLSKIDPPSLDGFYIALVEMENGSLGFAYIQDSSLYVLSSKVNSDGTAEWVQCWVIQLEKAIPMANCSDEELMVVGFVEGMGVIFVSTGAVLFTFELKSRQMKMVQEPGVYFSVLPYMSYYTPGLY